MLLGQAVMINWSDVAAEHRSAYYEWHSREHMQGRVSLPGFLRGRRYVGARARRDFLVMYEVDNIAVLTGEAYLAKANNPSPLTQRTTPFIQNSVRGLAQVRASFGVGLGGWALTLRFDPPPGREDSVERYLARNALPSVAQRSDITGGHLMVANRPASGIVPVERLGRPTEIPSWIVLVEAVSADALSAVRADALSNAALSSNAGAEAIEDDTYSLQIAVP
jgi:hypothetical protein